MNQERRVFLLVAALLSTFGGTAATSESETQHAPMPLKEIAAHHEGKPLYFVHLADPPLPVHAERTRHLSKTVNAFTGEKLNMDAAVNRDYIRYLTAKQRDLEFAIGKATGGSAAVTHRFQLALNALVVALHESDVERVRSLPGVTRVARVTTHQLHTDRGPTHIRAPEVWNGRAGVSATRGEGVIVGVIDSGIRPDHPSFADIGGDGYDHENPLGEGRYLGDCIDDPSLCNDKLIGVVSYSDITDSFNGERPSNGWDYHGHGTHVASTAAGNVLRDVPGYNVVGGEGEYRFAEISGVAPHANIVSYQVCFPGDGGCLGHLTVASIEHAIKNGIDVLNYSAGGGNPSPWESDDALAFLSARVAGIHVATSAGNNGPAPSTVTAPGNSPWLTSVAAYTHDRDYTQPTLTNFSGGTTPPAAVLGGQGITRGASGKVVKASDFGDALCRHPFAAGTFTGEIVVCERGENARVEKGRHVRAGGAGGMILIDMPGGDQGAIADFHELPAIHVDATGGQMLLDWLGSGSEHAATITSGEPVENDAAANYAADFTSRGPMLPFGSVPVPHVAAPGVSIYAAWIEDAPFRDQEFVAPFAFLDGTSMASPHVAGALALLREARPEWTPAEAQSALMTTAVPDTQRDRDDNPSTLFDAGAGMIDIAATMNAGLLFDEDETGYLSADPAVGGAPTDINLPAMANDACLLRCTWTRTVKATRNATWTALVRANPAMTVTVEPATFTLNAGQTLDLIITAEQRGEFTTEWLHEQIVLMPSDASISRTGMPLAVRFLAGLAPDYHTLTTRRDADRGEIPGFRSVTTDSLRIDIHGPVKAAQYEAFLSGDPTPTQPFDSVGEDAVQVVTVTTTTQTKVLVAEINAAAAPDVDLFIARDLDLDGKPTGAELAFGELCVSASETSAERCVVNAPPPGVYWVAVQNFEASAADAVDRHVLSVAAIEGAADGLAITAPDDIETGASYALDAKWNLDMQPGDLFYAAVDVGIAQETPGNIGRTLLRVERIADDFNVTADRAELVAGEVVNYAWTVEAIPADWAARDYVVTTLLPANVQTAVDDGGTVTGNEARWQFTQLPGAPARTGNLTLTTAKADTASEMTLEFVHTADGGIPVSATAATVVVAASPVARINGQTTANVMVEGGKLLELDVSASTGGLGDLDFVWEQLEGPSTAVQEAGSTLFRLPTSAVSVDTVLRYHLRAVAGTISSEPAELVVTVKPRKTSGSGGGGGASGGATLLLLAAVGLCRRRR